MRTLPKHGKTWMPSDIGSNLRWAGYAALTLVIVGNAVGNVLLKLGADAADDRKILFGLFGWQTFLGMACFGFGLLLYAWALKQFDLHAAQAIISLQYVLAILLASWFLGEHISLAKWAGIGLIAIGLYIVAR